MAMTLKFREKDAWWVDKQDAVSPGRATAGATPALKQPTSIPNSEQIDTSPRPPAGDQGRDSLEPEDEHLVIENLPAVRVIARRIFRLLPDHVSFARIYSAGVMGLVGALEEFHATNPVRFADFAKPKIRDAILDSLPDLVWEAEEQRRKGKLLKQLSMNCERS
jgi:DNA-directed RNA polymerase sigma subunit (sigma70/sigma32)